MLSTPWVPDIANSSSQNASGVLSSNHDSHFSTFSETNSSMSYDTHPNPTSFTNGMNKAITGLYAFGIMGNMMALGMLHCSEKKRNGRQILMLKYLAINDFLALSGSAVVRYAATLWKTPLSARCFCILRLLFRAFGLGSGCVAMVMAIERWLLMTKTFRHKKHVTMASIRCSIFVLWTCVLVVVCMPLMGFGLYYDETLKLDDRCVRYRFGTELKDRAYAMLMLIIGLMLCVCIVVCNVSVIRTICGFKRRASMRRVRSRTSYARQNSGNSQILSEVDEVHHTSDEVFFCSLMAVLCFFFVVCWLPQMISIVWGQIDSSNKKQTFYKIADFMMALNFSLDPYIYVVSRRLRKWGHRSIEVAASNSHNASAKPTPSTSRHNSVIKDGSFHRHSMEEELQQLKKNNVNEYI